LLPLVFAVGATQPTVTLPCVELALEVELAGVTAEEAVLVEEDEEGFTVISNEGTAAETVPSLAVI